MLRFLWPELAPRFLLLYWVVKTWLCLNLLNGGCVCTGDQSALIVYTSGTTGKPKGVVHTHASIGSQVSHLCVVQKEIVWLQCSLQKLNPYSLGVAWSNGTSQRGSQSMPIFGLCVRGQVRMLSKAWDYSSSDRILHCLPLHHILHQSKRFLYHHNGKYSCIWSFLQSQKSSIILNCIILNSHVHGLFNMLLTPLFVGALVLVFFPPFPSGIFVLDARFDFSHNHR